MLLFIRLMCLLLVSGGPPYLQRLAPDTRMCNGKAPRYT